MVGWGRRSDLPAAPQGRRASKNSAQAECSRSGGAATPAGALRRSAPWVPAMTTGIVGQHVRDREVTRWRPRATVQGDRCGSSDQR
jgi:hypothetical protein